MPSREQIALKYDKQIEAIDKNILRLREQITREQQQRDRLVEQKNRELESVKESYINEAKKGLDAIKSSWIDKISSKGNEKGEVQKFVNDKVKELEKQYPEEYDAIVGTLKKILKNKYDVSLEEEAQGAITTASIGSATRSTSDGGSESAPHGSSHIFAPSQGVWTRRGYKKPKKKQYKEYLDNFENNLID